MLISCVYRLGNKDKEENLARAIQQRIDITPADLRVGPKFCLQSPGGDTDATSAQDPYQLAIEEIWSLSKMVAPLGKLECIGRAN